MHGDDIPTEITKLVYTAPRIYDPTGYEFRPSQNDIAKLLAHFMPAIEQHVREQIAAEIEADTSAPPWKLIGRFQARDNWIDHREAVKAARIARGINPNT